MLINLAYWLMTLLLVGAMPAQIMENEENIFDLREIRKDLLHSVQAKYTVTVPSKEIQSTLTVEAIYTQTVRIKASNPEI
jgi:hypothetical protein